MREVAYKRKDFQFRSNIMSSTMENEMFASRNFFSKIIVFI
jgi:hypothetical protein